MKIIKHLLTWPKWLTFTLIFILFFLVSIKNLDPDLGWHIKSGEFFANGGAPLVEPFTYTASTFPFIDHEWLSNILVFFLYSIGGHTLLALIFAALWAISFFIISRKANIPGPLILIATIATLPYAGIRWVTFCMLFLSLLLTFYHSKKYKYLIIPLLVIWVNFHGSFILGLAVFAYLSMYDFITNKKRALKQLMEPSVAFIAIILATFINPYGPRIYEEIFRQVTDGSLRWAIQEWGINLPFATATYLFVFLLTLAFTFKKQLKTFLAAENVFLLAALSSQRHWPLFVLASLPATAKRLNSFLPGLYKKAKVNKPLRRILLSTLTLITCLATYSLYIIFSGSWDREAGKPKAAISYLEQHPCSGNLFNEYNDGGYLIQHLPSHKVFIDGRMPSWEMDGIHYMRTWEKIMEDDSFRNEQFEKYNITCALIYSSREEMIENLKSKGWETAKKTTHHTLLIRP
jgi:hypothetical protein